MPEQPQEDLTSGGPDGARPIARPRSLNHLAAGFFCVVAVTLVVPSLFLPGTLPLYKAGEIAEKTVKAIQTFTVEDREATALKREAAARRASVAFDLDLRVNDRLEAELRHIFATGRLWLEEQRRKSNLQPGEKLPLASQKALLQRLQAAFSNMSPPAALDVLIAHSFSPRLEDQSVALARSALDPPGVVAALDLLSRHRDRGIAIRNAVTGRQTPLQDLKGILELDQARQRLLQNRAILQLGQEGRTALAQWLGARLAPNLTFNESLTRLSEEQARRGVDPVLIQVQAGRTIVRAGEEVTPQDILLLDALRQRTAPSRLLGRMAGLAALTAFLLVSLRHFQPYFRRGLKPGADYFALACTLLIGALAAAKGALLLTGLAAADAPMLALQDASLLSAAAPFAVGAALMTLLGNPPLALLWSLVFALLATLMTGDLRTLFYALSGCIAAVLLLQDCLRRWNLVRAGLGVGLAQAMALVALQFYSSQQLNSQGLLLGLALAICSGMLAIVLAWLALPMLERLFGITTDVRLLELSDLNAPLLRRLAIEAPGTFHHSMLVGGLAEAAARSIGANPLLARAGAYYHDVGKLSQPGAYAENQVFQDQEQPPLTPLQSMRRQSAIVREGLKLAEESGLPTEVSDFIAQHLGTSRMDLRFTEGREAPEYSPGDQSDLRYPGPKPQSKEAAILMLADQAETSARALRRPSGDQIEGLVRRLVQAAVQDGQLDECPITVRDLDRIGRIFEKVLAEVHHRQVEYPGFDFDQKAEAMPVASPRLQ